VECSPYRNTSGWLPYKVVSEWLMDLRPEKLRYRQVDRTPSLALGSALPYTSDFVHSLRSGNAPNTTYGESGDAVCAPYAWPVVNISNPFAIAAITSGFGWVRAGSAVVQGHACRTWRSATMPWWSVCVSEDGSPRRFASPFGQLCELSNIHTGPIPDENFTATQACQTYPVPSCPSSSVENLTLYRLHSGSEPIVVENRDLVDVLGAPAIFCYWPSTRQYYVTVFTVQASASWGQYGRCHYNGTNYCDASTGKQVGRQSPQGLEGVPLQGQCSANQDRGSWYSFPAEGQCQPGEPIGSRGCTWIARPLRTVHAPCIKHKHGFERACKAEVGHGFYQPKSAAIIERALASNDSMKGGCPDAMLGVSHWDSILV